MTKAKRAKNTEEELKRYRMKMIGKEVTGKTGAPRSYQKRRQWNWLIVKTAPGEGRLGGSVC